MVSKVKLWVNIRGLGLCLSNAGVGVAVVNSVVNAGAISKCQVD